MSRARRLRDVLVITCEHASRAVPAGVDLGVGERVLRQHVAWDIGAAPAARALAAATGAPLVEGEVSRLVVDLNRGPRHPRLMAAESGGIAVPGNASLPPGERTERMARWWLPYRRRVEALVERRVAHGGCLHVSVHSFTPVLGGVRRRADVGLLYDPSRPGEVGLARRMAPVLAAEGLHVRFNYPYRGTSDGFVRALRRVHDARAYVGLEVELNQSWACDDAAAARAGGLLARALEQARGA